MCCRCFGSQENYKILVIYTQRELERERESERDQTCCESLVSDLNYDVRSTFEHDNVRVSAGVY